MKYKFYVLLAGMLGSQVAVGQSVDPQFSLFFFNPVYYNPAAAGAENVTRLQITHRTQWAGYQGSLPDGGALNTQMISASVPLTRINSGVGIYAFNDALGPQTNQAIQLSYAYRLKLKNGTLALGVQGGLASQSLDFGRFIFIDPNDPDIPAGGRYVQAQPDLGAGLFYDTPDYWIGVSMRHITQPGFRLGSDRTINALWRTTFLTAGYRLGVGYDLEVQPSILYQYSNQPGVRASSVAANVLATYQGRYWAGLGYRQSDAVTATIGLNLMRNNALRLGYAFDFTAGGAAAKAPTSHELLLSYALPAPSTNRRPPVRTPRFRY